MKTRISNRIKTTIKETTVRIIGGGGGGFAGGYVESCGDTTVGYKQEKHNGRR